MKVAVIGAGLMGHWHARIASHLDGRLVAVVDPDMDRAQSVVKRMRGAEIFTDVGSMLKAIHPDIVHICTPPETHVSIALEAINAGSHVLVEKPTAPSAPQVKELLDAAKAKGVIVCPVHQFGFQRGVERMKRTLAALGDPVHVSFEVCSAGGQSASAAELSLAVADILPHPLSLLRTLWPEKLLNADEWRAASSRRGDILISGEMDGILVSFLISMHARPTQCAISVRCSGGTVDANLFHGYSVVRRGGVSRLNKIVNPFAQSAGTFTAASTNLFSRVLRQELAYPGLRELMKHFYSAVQGVGPSPISNADTMAVAVAKDVLVSMMLDLETRYV